MAGPIFDKEQYELRGRVPVVTGREQKEALESVVERVNSQIDWNAQLLGFNGPRYWGRRIPREDGIYEWEGLPKTVSEKRAVQVGTFGVYNKDKDYDQRPAPFNRASVRASADQAFDVYEEGGKTRIVPLGQPQHLLYEKTPRLIVGGEYTFNALVDAETSGESQDSIFVTQDLDQGITSVRILNAESNSLFIKREGSEAEPAIFFFELWADSSDWTSDQILNQFIGVWGNKGNPIASHFLFDALDVHGFNEEEGLSLDNILRNITLSGLLELVGLKPGPATPYNTSHLNFLVEGCDDFYQPTTSLETKIVSLQTQDLRDLLTEDGRLLSLDDPECFSDEPDAIRFLVDGQVVTGDVYDNGSFDDPQPVVGTLDNSEYPLASPAEATVSDGGAFVFGDVELTTESGLVLSYDDPSAFRRACYQPPDPEFGECETPNFRMVLRQSFDDDPAGIATDPGPEASVPIGANGVRFLDPISGLIDNGEFDRIPAQFFLDGGEFEPALAPASQVSEGVYDRNPFAPSSDPLPEDFYERSIEGFDLAMDVNGGEGPVIMSDVGIENEIVLIASGSPEDGYDGDIIAFDGLELSSVSFEYEAKTTYGEVRFPCVEWVFDPTLDNSTYFPTAAEAAWMTADDGEYDERAGMDFVSFASQLSVECLGGDFRGGFLAFDDGEYDESIQPFCGPEFEPLCKLADGGVLGPNNPVPVSRGGPNTLCSEECGNIDNGDYIFGQIPFSGPPGIDGLGSVDLRDDCVLYDGEEYDRTPSPQDSCVSYDNFFIGEVREELCRLADREFDAEPAPFQIDQGEYFEGLVAPVCTPCGEPLPPPQCYLDNGIVEDAFPSFSEDEGLYDKGPILCTPCDPEPDPPAPCPVEPLRVRLDQIIFSSPAWRMRPSVVNSQTPLRLWKSRVLNVFDVEPGATNAFPNPLIADNNTGPEVSDSFRHFARLPVEYSRNSKFWNRTEATLSNLSSFSRVTPPVIAPADPLEIPPVLYDDAYSDPIDDIEDSTVFYAEDYLCSSISETTLEDQVGFFGSSIGFEKTGESRPYNAGAVTDYDAYETRVLRDDGSRSGSYIKWNGPKRILTGHLQTDIDSGVLRYALRGERQLFDSSLYEAPNIDFPDDDSSASFSNYSVSYAYFVADLSAADDPVFDPTALFNHRNKVLCVPEVDFDELTTEDGRAIFTQDFEPLVVGYREEIIESQLLTYSKYVFHDDEIPACKEPIDISAPPPSLLPRVTGRATISSSQLSLIECGSTQFTLDSLVGITSPFIGYQWQINTGTAWVNLTNSLLYSGVETELLTLTNASVSLDGANFRLKVTSGLNPQFTTFSNILTLQVSPAVITISQQPQSVILTTTPAPVIFQVEATTNDGSQLLYQWQQNDGAGWIDLIDGPTVFGALTSTLLLNADSNLNGYGYRALVSSGGCAPITPSQTAIISPLPVFGLAWTTTANNPCDSTPWVVTDATNQSIRYNIADSSNCGGTCGSTQSGTATATITVGPNDTLMGLDFEGIGELQDAGFERMTFLLNGIQVASAESRGLKLGCTQFGPVNKVYNQAPPYLLPAGTTHKLEILFTTGDPLFHVGCYYQVDLSFTTVP